jgi:tetratricopeptide (TPR) repeat protein
MMRTYIALVLGIVIVAQARPAAADKARSTPAKDKAAQKACAKGDYQKGVDILADLLVDTKDPTFIYNQGRCYQQNNRWEQAISRFKEYLRKAKDISNNDREEAESQIRDCEQSLGKATYVAPPPISPQEGAVAPTAMAPALRTPETTLPAAPMPPSPPPPDAVHGKGLRIAGIVCAAVGVAAIGSGVGLALKTQSISSDEQKNGPTQAKEDQRKSLETWGWVSYGFGAAAITTGAILYVVGWPSSQSNTVALVPILAPNGPSVMLKGSF